MDADHGSVTVGGRSGSTVGVASGRGVRQCAPASCPARYATTPPRRLMWPLAQQRHIDSVYSYTNTRPSVVQAAQRDELTPVYSYTPAASTSSHQSLHPAATTSTHASVTSAKPNTTTGDVTSHTLIL